MNDVQLRERSLFLKAIEFDSPEAVAVFLDDACSGDEQLRRSVEALLQANQESGDLFDQEPTLSYAPLTEQPGDTIGPYKLLQQIGEGGMGVVYMAEQTEPVERRVALKIIKPGMDTQQVIARFEAERQALAMMDHPNIAKVLDAGATETGRPYFVMELVKGMPVTEFCDEHQMTPKERLELFIPICQAVQHAHQKGIIHRDLKPTNILVAEYDDKPVPKVIDFGVAKAISQKLTEKTMFTQYGQIVGTIEYMSPEQAKLNQLDVDTRSDVYSLGVLLYELLTGETPFDKKRLHSATFAELLQILREEEPPRPSHRLSSSETLPTISANRHTEPHRLCVLVRGELDWIVMKALEKDRSRRYETPNEFAADVSRYLNHEPVEAGPPSKLYRLRKFARRNKATFALSSLAVVSLVMLTVGAFSYALSVRKESRQRIELNQKISDAVAELKQFEDRAQRGTLDDEGAWFVANQTVDRAQALAKNDLADRELVERVHRTIAEFQEAGRDRELSLNLSALRDEFGGRAVSPGIVASGQNPSKPQYAEILRKYGIPPVTMPATEAAELISTKPQRVREVMTISLYVWLGCARSLQFYLSEQEVAEKDWAREVLMALESDSWRRRLLEEQGKEDRMELIRDPAFDTQPPHALLILASKLTRRERDEAVAVLTRARKLYPDDYWINLQLSKTVRDATEALRFASIAVALKPSSPEPLLREGDLLKHMGRTAEAREVYEHALKLGGRADMLAEKLGDLFREQGNLDAAIAAYRRAIENHPDKIHHISRLQTYDKLKRVLEQGGRMRKLESFLNETVERYPENIRFLGWLAEFHYQRGNWSGAIDGFVNMREVDVERLGLTAPQQVMLADALVCAKQIEPAKREYRFLVEHLPWFLSENARAEMDEPRLTLVGHVSINDLQQAADLLPEDPLVQSALGVALFTNKRQEQAVEKFEAATKLDPTWFPAAYNLARAHASEERFEDAIGEYRRAAELDSQSASFWLDYGNALQNAGRHQEAVEAFERSFDVAEFRYKRYLKEHEAHPDITFSFDRPSPDWYYPPVFAQILAKGALMGLVRSRLAMATEADELDAMDSIHQQLLKLAESSELVFEQNPARADLYVGQILLAKKRLTSAKSAFESAIATDPKLSSAYYELAHVYCDLKEWERALKMAEKSVELVPSNRTFQNLLDQLRTNPTAKPEYQNHFIIEIRSGL